MMQNLYKDWLAADCDWMKTQTYCKAVEKSLQTRKGKYIYKMFKDLVSEHGEDRAKIIRTNKKAAELARTTDEEPFWMAHPEVKDDEDRIKKNTYIRIQHHIYQHRIHASNIHLHVLYQSKIINDYRRPSDFQHVPNKFASPCQNYELFKVWDSFTLENEESRQREWGMRHDAHMADSKTTRALLYLGLYGMGIILSTSTENFEKKSSVDWWHFINWHRTKPHRSAIHRSGAVPLPIQMATNRPPLVLLRAPKHFLLLVVLSQAMKVMETREWNRKRNPENQRKIKRMMIRWNITRKSPTRFQPSLRNSPKCVAISRSSISWRIWNFHSNLIDVLLVWAVWFLTYDGSYIEIELYNCWAQQS